MADGLLLAWLSLAWGAEAVVPWRLAGGAAGRRLWGYGALPLLLTGAIAAILYYGRHPDAALAVHLLPLGASLAGRLLLALFVALLAVATLTAFGGSQMEGWSFRITAGFGLAALAAACWIAEALREGEGPESAGPLVFGLTLCRLAVALAAGEIAAPGRPAVAPAAALCLPVYALLLPAPLRSLLAHGGQLVTLGAGAVLLVAARWLPPSLRRVALLGGVLLASLFFSQAADLASALGAQPLPPLPPLPGR